MSAVTLLNAVTVAPTTGAAMGAVQSPSRTFQASVTGTGAVTATVTISGSNDGVNWVPLGTITLSGTAAATDGFVSQAVWLNIQAALTAISGTGAACTAVMGV